MVVLFFFAFLCLLSLFNTLLLNQNLQNIIASRKESLLLDIKFVNASEKKVLNCCFCVKLLITVLAIQLFSSLGPHVNPVW